VNCFKCFTPNTNTNTCEQCGASLLATPDPMLGRLLAGKYEIIKKIGAGGFGAVYEAQHTRLSSKIAIKTLHSSALQHDDIIERFRREALATSSLQSPYVVKIFDRGGAEDGTLWLAMEFIEGETLEQHLTARGKLSEEETLRLLSMLCDALEEAHQRGIIHRDLKPQNIMLSPSAGGPIPKLLDFGIAGLSGASNTLTNTGAISGTPKYMSPEQWEGLKNTDARSDIYSLGVIAYQCLSGVFPYEADSPLAWMKQHTFGTPRPIEEVAPQLSVNVQRAVMRAIAKDPAERPQSALLLRQQLTGLSQVAPASPVTPQRSTSDELTLEHRPHTEPPTIKKSARLPRIVGALLVFVPLLFWAVSSPEPPSTQILAQTTSTQTTEPASVLVTQPASQPETTPADDLRPLRDGCKTAPEDERLALCLRLLEVKNLSPEDQQLANTQIEEHRETHLKSAREALQTSLPKAKLSLDKLKALKDDPEVQRVQRQYDELLKKQRLWERVIKNQQGPDYKAACAALKEYLSLKILTPEERRIAQKKGEIDFSDATLYGDCAP
jgi:serine/threonine protein kinase